jgi:RsiW-degrading membrane proteinase PrsW (M82 family)
MVKNNDYFDVRNEPWLKEGAFKTDPSEQKVPPTASGDDELADRQNSVAYEPALTGKLEQPYIGDWIQEQRQRCSLAGNLGATLLAALIGGPFAVVGAFMAGRQTSAAILYTVLFAPIIEELLKQSGMIYLLEKKPYRLFSATQFLFGALISALIFAGIENLMYIHLYTAGKDLNNPADYALFRWTVCTGLHGVCSLIASIGLIRLWKRQQTDGRAIDLAGAYPCFATAMVLHGLYNLTVSILNPSF